ncbi:MAG: DNA mismatch repair protein MutS [Candidatus Shikimatogenerans sp. Tcar]|uniref:DNA mismatch repair protein MutS n=1 Tax=Candidatus Shikimatogenerans sp. Tcar TaxID=3158565 RepID=A0AAU7QSM9_9FLAO
MDEYYSIKKKFKKYIILFQVGEFYEIFNKDAIKCSKVLNIILTKRNIGKYTKNILLSGFPCCSLNNYLNKLLYNKFKIVICNQIKKKKKIYRKITNIITPGTIIDYKLLNNKNNNNYIASIYIKNNIVGLSLLDISTREFYTCESNIFFIKKIIYTYNISEILYNIKQKHIIKKLFIKKNILLHKIYNWFYDYKIAYNKLLIYLNINNFKIYGINNLKLSIITIYILYKYLLDNNFNILKYFNKIKLLNNNKYLYLDDYSINNLELLKSYNGISLYNFLNKNITSSGNRLLKKWIINPIKNKKKLLIRYNLINFFLNNKNIKELIKKYLKKIYDIERLYTKLLINTISIKELYKIYISIKNIYKIYNILNYKFTFFKIDNNIIFIYKKVYLKIKKIINIKNILNKKNIINLNISKKLDNIYYKYKKIKIKLKKYIKKKKKKYKFNLKFNKYLGYYIETKKNYKNISKKWIHKQTLLTTNRYKTKYIFSLEKNLFFYKNLKKIEEKNIFIKLINKIKKYYIYINNIVKSISIIDIIISFTTISKKFNYTQPIIKYSINNSYIKLIKARHPIVEYLKFKKNEDYIPNNIKFNNNYNIIIISGPNMSGKSIFLRKISLIIILAQIGCYVPAKYFKFTIFNKIFTRIGFNDNINSGESTFMVEMTEISNTINNLDYKTLIIFDEIGRGTSNYDGISIAWSIIDYLYNNLFKPILIISTHYHELNLMKTYYKFIRNYSFKIKKINNKIFFLRKIIKKENNNSYGIEIATLLKLPNIIINKAKCIYKKLSNGYFLKNKRK